MGILTGMLFAGIIGKWVKSRNKKLELKLQELAKLHQTHQVAVIDCPECNKNKKGPA